VPVGTPEYMSPEHMRGRVGDARADLYSLAVLLYEALTGELPWPGGDFGELLRGKQFVRAAPVTTSVPEVGPGLAAILSQALEPRPGHRQASAAAMLAQLRDPDSVPPRDPELTRRWWHRDWRPAAATLAIVAALSLIGGTVWLAHRRIAEADADRAVEAGQRIAAPGAHTASGAAARR